MKNCSVFASLISPSKMILFEKKYQTFDTVFHHQMKHCVSCLIYYLKTIEDGNKYSNDTQRIKTSVSFGTTINVLLSDLAA